ncbi:hypothetical protein QTP70_015962 [Hemibagrus guttatus]|uniref:Alkylated DNA repair protein AlkB homologue 8 N-terminal domain-containing protein n=1 Tax=Hemibagrus guttatus TaxID=175788 RepID=A0AAE0PTZ2_9TELE|nr:hypothetical protein QTP70_015962 [Hemibagrus guttatus]
MTGSERTMLLYEAAQQLGLQKVPKDIALVLYHPHSFTPQQTPHLPPLTPLTIKEEEVNRLFKRLNTRKATGPDSVSPSLLKHCANQLSPVFTDIFNTSLETCHVPASLQDLSHWSQSPKKTKITGLNDYRPVALTSVVMKSFERLVLSYLKDITDPLLDPLQFAYRANRSVDDAVKHGPPLHPSASGFPRILCQDTLSNQHWIPPRLCPFSSAILPYTNGCTSGHQSVKHLKFADDTTLIGLISDGNESAYRGEMDRLVSMPPAPPVILCDSPVSSAESFCFLGTTITKELKWAQNISSLTKKAQQRMYFLRQLKKFLLPVKMLVNFYTAIIESVLTSSITVLVCCSYSQGQGQTAACHSHQLRR